MFEGEWEKKGRPWTEVVEVNAPGRTKYAMTGEKTYVRRTPGKLDAEKEAKEREIEDGKRGTDRSHCKTKVGQIERLIPKGGGTYLGGP